MSEWMWYLTRSTGIVAALLAVATIIWGLFFSGRNTGRRLKANWWLTLHSRLGGLTLAFTVLHMLLALLDTDAGLRLVDLFVPNARAGWAVGWGVVAFWLFAALVLSSSGRIRRRLPRKSWHLLHMLSFPAVVLTAVHAIQAGSDSLAAWFTRGLALLVGLTVYPLTVRLIGVAQRHHAVA